jgi:hypothetical protein
MADGVAITAGSGTTILTDDTGAGGHAQVVKLAISTDGSGTLIPADATVGMSVNVTQALADDAAFTVATSKVMPTGFMADDTSTDLVDEGDAGIARMTRDRRQIVQLGESAAKDVKGGGTQTGTADQSIMAAGGAGVYNYLQWVTVYNSSATNTYVNVKDGSTVIAVLPLPAYGGCMFMPPRAIRSTANTAFNLAAGASVTTAYLYGGGYTSTG